MDTNYRRPSIFETYSVPHYYGDRVRELFVAGALLSFIAMPIWGNLLPFGVLTQVSAGLLLVLLAGLTNPHGKGVLILDTIVAGVSVLLLESVAILLRTSESWPLFVVREASALILLVAFYFSVKTVRAALQGKVGAIDRPEEFGVTK